MEFFVNYTFYLKKNDTDFILKEYSGVNFLLRTFTS